jgi:hypothetical protein
MMSRKDDGRRIVTVAFTEEGDVKIRQENRVQKKYFMHGRNSSPRLTCMI